MKLHFLGMNWNKKRQALKKIFAFAGMTKERSATKKKKQMKKGFSLVELLTTVGIIGILSAVAIPSYNKYRQNAAEAAAENSAENLIKAFQACLSDGTLIGTCATANIDGALTKNCAGAQSAAVKAGMTPADMDGCDFATKSGTGVTCYSQYHVTGGYVASACRSYDPGTGQITGKEGGKEFGGNFPSMTVCINTGVCAPP